MIFMAIDITRVDAKVEKVNIDGFVSNTEIRYNALP